MGGITLLWFAMPERLSRRQRILLNAVMLGILVASGAAAWLLVHMRRQERIDAVELGAQIISKIKTRGLGHYWPQDNPEVLWYLVNNTDGREVGWNVLLISPRDGQYRGREIFTNSVAGSRSEENWSVDADLASVRYEGIIQAPNLVQRTRITFDNGKVTVARGDRAVESSVPDNYIPEGIFNVVLREVVSAGEVADFMMIFNSEAIADGRVNFQKVIISPQGGGKAVVNLPGRSVNTYTLDQDGKITRIKMRGRGLVFELVPKDTLEKYFRREFHREPPDLPDR